MDGATNRLVAKFARVYAEASPDDQFALRAWMRDIILGRKVRKGSMVHARRIEKRMVEACDRRLLNSRSRWSRARSLRAQTRGVVSLGHANYDGIVFRIERVRAKAGK